MSNCRTNTVILCEIVLAAQHPNVFVREERGLYRLRDNSTGGIQREFSQAQNWHEPFSFGKATLIHADCFDWIEKQAPNSFHAVVTDPPYGLHEYTPEQQAKLRKGTGAGGFRLHMTGIQNPHFRDSPH